MKAMLPLALLAALAIGSTAEAAGNGGQHNWNKSQVRQLQGQLKQQGYDVGQVDGVIGPTTQQALRQFQQDQGIQATGQPDQRTVAALQQNTGTQQGQLPSGGSRDNGSSSGGGNNNPGASDNNMGSGGMGAGDMGNSGSAPGASQTSQPPSGGSPR